MLGSRQLEEEFQNFIFHFSLSFSAMYVHRLGFCCALTFFYFLYSASVPWPAGLGHSAWSALIGVPWSAQATVYELCSAQWSNMSLRVIVMKMTVLAMFEEFCSQFRNPSQN